QTTRKTHRVLFIKEITPLSSICLSFCKILMARTLQYFTIFFLLHLLICSINILHVTEARPVVMVKNSGKPFVVVKNSGPSPGIGHRKSENSGIAVEDVDGVHVHSGPSPGEGHK
uniref:Uncharacterized protein LOC104216889 n=1 Tax=Nicotiana sylvestris TaxID=4096 RepID=A0A1U7VK56_NICSY